MIVDRRGALLVLAGGVVACRAVASPLPVRRDLYRCEGCEAVRERDGARLAATALLAGPDEPGERLLLTGRVFGADGRAPVAGVVIYAHHTNAAGQYANGSNESEWSRRHGRLRGWVRSDADGRYAFRTIKPAPYPNRDIPAHIHLFVGEPGRRPYYLDDVVFAGAFGVTPRYVAAQEMRGGSGIVSLRRQGDGTLLAVRDVRLERHPG